MLIFCFVIVTKLSFFFEQTQLKSIMVIYLPYLDSPLFAIYCYSIKLNETSKIATLSLFIRLFSLLFRDIKLIWFLTSGDIAQDLFDAQFAHPCQYGLRLFPNRQKCLFPVTKDKLYYRENKLYPAGGKENREKVLNFP